MLKTLKKIKEKYNLKKENILHISRTNAEVVYIINSAKDFRLYITYKKDKKYFVISKENENGHSEKIIHLNT